MTSVMIARTISSSAVPMRLPALASSVPGGSGGMPGTCVARSM